MCFEQLHVNAPVFVLDVLLPPGIPVHVHAGHFGRLSFVLVQLVTVDLVLVQHGLVYSGKRLDLWSALAVQAQLCLRAGNTSVCRQTLKYTPRSPDGGTSSCPRR